MQTIHVESYGAGKFPNTAIEKVWQDSLDGPDAECGDVDTNGVWYGLMLYPEGLKVIDQTGTNIYRAIVLITDNSGFVSGCYYHTQKEAKNFFEKVEAKLFQEAFDA